MKLILILSLIFLTFSNICNLDCNVGDEECTSCYRRNNLIDWDYCQRKHQDRRSFSIPYPGNKAEKYELDIQVIEGSSVVKRGQMMEIKITAKLVKGTLNHPRMHVQLKYKNWKLDIPFELCYDTLCPITEGETRTITLKKRIPLIIPRSYLNKRIEVVGEIEEHGTPVECITFEIEIKE